MEDKGDSRKTEDGRRRTEDSSQWAVVGKRTKTGTCNVQPETFNLQALTTNLTNGHEYENGLGGRAGWPSPPETKSRRVGPTRPTRETAMKMRTKPLGLVPPKAGPVSLKAAFTLVEMLVVIAILGILLAMMVPAAGMILRRAAVARARSGASIVVTTMGKYHAEYNRWPRSYVQNGRDLTDADWVNTMAPDPSLSATVPDNFKRIILFQPGSGALNAAGEFADPWGTPYKFVLDVTGTGQIPNPNLDVGGNPIRARALVWSAGPDKNYDTWADNVTSWE